MAVIKAKTKKAIIKQFNKLVRKHGTEIAIGLISNLMTGVASAKLAASEDGDQTEKKKKKKKKADADGNGDEQPKKKKSKK